MVFSSADVDERTYFSEGLMPLRNPEGRWGFADRDFQWLIRPKYDWAKEFSDGLAPIKSAGNRATLTRTAVRLFPEV